MFGSKRAFSPPDAWDDTGLFTVAPRPKTVPSGRTRGEQHALVAGVARFSPRPLLTPSVVGDSADCKRDLLRKPIDSAGRSLRGVGFGLWSKRRRELGGGAGDAAVEFLDVREAALVSVMEALARRALPWQAQLCPRALQDLEVARVRVRGGSIIHFLEPRLVDFVENKVRHAGLVVQSCRHDNLQIRDLAIAPLEPLLVRLSVCFELRPVSG